MNCTQIGIIMLPFNSPSIWYQNYYNIVVRLSVCESKAKAHQQKTLLKNIVVKSCMGALICVVRLSVCESKAKDHQQKKTLLKNVVVKSCM